MRTVTVAGIRLDILRHARVRGENFPRPDPGAIAESFVIDVFDATTSAPIDLYPNHVPHPHPEAPNRLTIRWVGREIVPVFAPFIGGVQVTDAAARLAAEGTVSYQQVGTKRGADFRSRFWPSVLRRVGKAQLAARGTRRIGDITDAQIAIAPKAIRDRLKYAGITDPVNLRAVVLDDAVEALTGARPQLATALERGTVTNIDATFDSRSDGTASDETTGIVYVGFTTYAGQFRFSLTALGTGDTVNDSDFQFDVQAKYVNGTAYITAYGTSGADDPDTDTAANKNSKSTGGTALGNVAVTASGSHTVDLGATADGYIAGNIDAPDTFAVGAWDGTSALDIDIEAIEHAQTDPATLTVDHTAGGGGYTGTPGVASLTLTAQTPAVGMGVVPGVLANTLTAQAPSLVFGTGVSPGVLAAALEAFAPTVVAPLSVSPGILAALLEAFAPTVAATANQVVTPGILAAVLAAQAPSASVDLALTPGILALATALFAPTLLTPWVGSPGVLELVTALQTPAANVGTNVSPGPFTRALALNRAVAASADDAEENSAGATLVNQASFTFDMLDATTEWVGLRFRDVRIPQGAVVNTASIAVVPGFQWDEPLVTIYGEDHDDPGAFTTATNDISGRTRTTASVAWSSTDLGADGTARFSSPDLSTILQEIVNRAGWVSGNSLVILIQGGSDAARDLAFKTYEAGSGIPELDVNYTSGPVLTPQTPTVTVSDHTSVTPDILALVTALRAPSVVLDTLLTPGILAAALTAFAPTVDITTHYVATPGILEAVLTAFAPTVSLAGDTTLTPGQLALILSPQAPAVFASQSVHPGVLALVTDRFAAVASLGTLYIPGVASLSLAGQAPSLLFGTALEPGSLALTITLYTPDGKVTTHIVTGRYRPQAGSSVFNRPGRGVGSYHAPRGDASTFRRPGSGA